MSKPRFRRLGARARRCFRLQVMVNMNLYEKVCAIADQEEVSLSEAVRAILEHYMKEYDI